VLHTKEDYINCLESIISPLKNFYTSGFAGLKCGSTGASYGETAALLEGFSRVLWGLAPLWGGGHDCEGFSAIYLQGIINGTDPAHSEYWGEYGDSDQRMVETAAIGLALILAPEKIWNPLTDVQKKNLCSWLWQMNHRTCGENNWKFFAILVNLGLKNVGASYSKETIKANLESINSYYVSNGWYHDGRRDQADYYIAFAIHFYSLIYAKVMERDDPETSRLFKERSMVFAKDFIYWFAEDGSALAFGRSLTYRFAQCCFWSACVFAGIEPFPMGVMKGIIARNLEWWLSHPIMDGGNVLTIGYAYPNLLMSEQYNCFGSPYWALKSFLILALDDNHEFFQTEALPLPKLETLKVIPEAYMTIQRHNGYPVALTAGQWAVWGPAHCECKYSKFAYSSKYAFNVPRSYFNLEQASPDSMLAFEVNGMIYVRRKCLDYNIREDGTVYSKWSPSKGIEVETEIVPKDGGHIRKHIVVCEEETIAYDCAFSTPGQDEGSIYGNGEKMFIKCIPNTNLIHPNTNMQAVKYVFPKGKTIVETVVDYPMD